MKINLLLLLTALIFVSCASKVSMQKRKYRQGFHFAFMHSLKPKENKVVAKQQIFKNYPNRNETVKSESRQVERPYQSQKLNLLQSDKLFQHNKSKKYLQINHNHLIAKKSVLLKINQGQLNRLTKYKGPPIFFSILIFILAVIFAIISIEIKIKQFSKVMGQLSPTGRLITLFLFFLFMAMVIFSMR